MRGFQTLTIKMTAKEYRSLLNEKKEELLVLEEYLQYAQKAVYNTLLCYPNCINPLHPIDFSNGIYSSTARSNLYYQAPQEDLMIVLAIIEKLEELENNYRQEIQSVVQRFREINDFVDFISIINKKYPFKSIFDIDSAIKNKPYDEIYTIGIIIAGFEEYK